MGKINEVALHLALFGVRIAAPVPVLLALLFLTCASPPRPKGPAEVTSVVVASEFAMSSSVGSVLSYQNI